MELILIGLIAAIVLFFALRSRQSEKRIARPQSASSSEPPSTNELNPEITGIQPPPFDDASAKHLPEPRILVGSAYVIDGDTIRINKTQIRLFGVDAPELNHPYGKKAKWALHRLCKDRVVRAEVTDEDAHGRTVAHCYLPDGRDLSAEMVRQGLALDWPKFSGGKYRSLETLDARKKLFLADARQKGRMQVWEKYEAKQGNN